jgi:hypothetical protein
VKSSSLAQTVLSWRDGLPDSILPLFANLVGVLSERELELHEASERHDPWIGDPWFARDG